MAELFDLIQNRRSVRKYEDKQIPENLLNQVLEAGRWAPSWHNFQCWEVVVVKDQAIKKKLQDAMPAKGNPATKAIIQAPVVLGVCAKMESSGYYKGASTTKFGDWMMFDLGLFTQNICLTAHDLGLGTVIVGLYNHDQAKTAIDVPAGYELVVLIPLGYPAKQPTAPPRKQIKEFVHENTF